MAKRNIGTITLVVRNYDNAIRFYTENLNFKLIQDIGLAIKSGG
ncbi:VOC family protein [Aquimarina sp. M1]